MKKILYALMGCLFFIPVKAQKNPLAAPQTEWIHFKPAQQISAVQLALDKFALELGENDDLQLLAMKDDKLGYRHYRYQQTYKGIPVEGAIYLMHEKANRTKKANGQLIRDLHLHTVPGISEADALLSALRYVGADMYAWEDATYQDIIRQVEQDENATFYPSGNLVIIDPEFEQNADNYRLAYEFDIYSTQPLSRQIVYIDAQNNDVLTSVERLHSCTDVPASGNSNYSGTVDFTACQENGTHTLKSHINGVTQQVFNAGNTQSMSQIPFTDSDGFFEADPTAVDVRFAAQKTYDYFWETYSRNSLDDDGISLNSWVHYGNNYNNAHWTGSFMVYGDGDGERFNALTAPDIVAHEMAHGITDFASDLRYFGESGALNESFSDIFGEAVEAHIRGSNDWIIGAECTAVSGKNGIRNMRNPNDANMLIRQPDTYLGNYWYTGEGDNGGVHYNSGVQNYWFYLLSEGGSGINDKGDAYHVTGIGMSKAATITYHNLTNYITPNSSYEDARIGAIQAAIDLYNIDSDEVLQTQAAWCAVGVGNCDISVPNCRLSDSLALVDFYDALNPTSSLWDLSQPIDTWYGVFLNENQCVDSLVIRDRNLNGTLSPSIGNLSELRILSFPECRLSGTIPSTVGNLVNLAFFDLGENNFTGHIPPEIGNLINLVHLGLNHNVLIGHIPPEIGNLNNLARLYLSNNQLDGCYSGNLKNLCNSLNVANVSGSNNFDASWGDFCTSDAGLCLQDMPCPVRDSILLTQFYHATNGQNWTTSWNLSAPMNTWHGITLNAEGCVESIILGTNNLTGTLPTSIGDLSELKVFALGGNEIGGTILPEIGQMTKLTNLGLGGNNFTGTIPAEIGDLLNLEQLWLNDSENLDGSLPSQLGQLTKLTHLTLNNCNFTGSLPAELSEMEKIRYWRLENNNLSGCYPPELAVLCSRLHPDFSTNDKVSVGNNFDANWEDFCNLNTGACPPPSCREIDSLALVDFFYAANGNNWYSSIRWDLNQPIDTWYGVTLNENQCVDTLFIKEKDINGTLSPSIGNLSEIRFINLPENFIGGTIPNTIGNLVNLTFLDIGDNNFTGHIPPEIGNLTNLAHLGLSHNALIGNIPPEIGNLNNLTLLALSHNQLNGCYADNLTNLCALSMTALISTGNNFDASWGDFCNNGTGACQLVWPGDFNNDGIANNIDALFWGLAIDNTGPTRPNATTSWTAQLAPEWSQTVVGINSKYQDADGSGTIDINDLDVLVQNYGLMRGSPASANANSPLQFELKLLSSDEQPDGIHQRFGIYLSSSLNTPISAHGLAFSFDISQLPVISTQLDTGSSALIPSESLSIYDDTLGYKKLHVALTRTDKNNQLIINGDLIAEAIIIVEDVQSGDPFNATIEGGSAAAANGIINSINGTSLYGIFSYPGIDIPLSIVASVVHEQCNTPGKASAEVLSGTPPYTYNWSTGANTAEITHLTAGTYTVEVMDANGQQQSLSIQVDAAAPIYDEVGNEITCNLQTSWLMPQLSLMLEGAYDSDTGMMTNWLKQHNLLPDLQPYTNVPWNYNGQEGQNWTTTNYPDNAVDWVLVSFRDAQNTDRVYAKTAAVLQQDGSLFFPNDRFLSAEVADSMHVLIQHRNHIAAMTPEPLPADNQALVYDFSLNDSYHISTSVGQKQLPDGTWVMLTGNCYTSDNAGYDINGQDKSLWGDSNGVFNKYLAPDLNMDGDINGADKSLWSENNGLSSQVPK